MEFKRYTHEFVCSQFVCSLRKGNKFNVFFVKMKFILFLSFNRIFNLDLYVKILIKWNWLLI